MIKVDDEVAIVGCHRFTEYESADTPPIGEAAPLKEYRALGRAFVRYLDLKRQAARWRGIASVVDLRHDFIAKIQSFAADPWLE
jgi:hypothetical protein